MLFAQRFFEVRTESRQRGLERGNVGVQPRQVGCGVFGVLRRERTHQGGTEWDYPQLQQPQHFGAGHTGTVKGHDLGLEASGAQA